MSRMARESLRWVRFRPGVIEVQSTCQSKERKRNNQPEESEGSESASEISPRSSRSVREDAL